MLRFSNAVSTQLPKADQQPVFAAASPPIHGVVRHGVCKIEELDQRTDLAAVIARVPKARMSISVRCRVIWSSREWGRRGTSQGSPRYLGVPECLR